MGNKVLNFDLFMQEKKKEMIEVTVFGDKYMVPNEIPAIVPVMMARAEESSSDADGTRAVMRAADALFGEQNVDTMCKKGMSASDLATLMQKIFTMINGKDEEETTEELSDEDSRTVKPGNKEAKK